MVDGLESAFPRLAGTDYRVTSPRDDAYNCIAWAAGATDNWWWPVGTGRTYWPSGAPRAVTVDAFREAFASLGYIASPTEELESQFEKIALFAKAEDKPTHAARQLPSGRWTSKLGMMEDIEHALRDLEGTVYGSVVLIVKRPRSS